MNEVKEVVEILIKVGGGITAIGIIGTLIYKVVVFFQHQKAQDAEIEALKKRVREENTLMCYALSACLDGLQQLGANHTVPKAKDKLDKYLNQEAHK